MSELTRATYFAQNNCLYPLPAAPCPRYPYPLENVPQCKGPCVRPSVREIYGEPTPTELYGDAVGNPLIYYHYPTSMLSLSTLTIPPHPQPFEAGRPYHSA